MDYARQADTKETAIQNRPHYSRPRDETVHPRSIVSADGSTTLKRYRVDALIYAPDIKTATERAEQAALYLDAASVYYTPGDRDETKVLRVTEMTALNDGADVLLTLTAGGSQRHFRLGGTDAAGLAGALRALSPYHELDLDRIRTARDSLAQAVSILEETN